MDSEIDRVKNRRGLGCGFATRISEAWLRACHRRLVTPWEASHVLLTLRSFQIRSGILFSLQPTLFMVNLDQTQLHIVIVSTGACESHTTLTYCTSVAWNSTVTRQRRRNSVCEIESRCFRRAAARRVSAKSNKTTKNFAEATRVRNCRLTPDVTRKNKGSPKWR